jgi:hypothetical protein
MISDTYGGVTVDGVSLELELRAGSDGTSVGDAQGGVRGDTSVAARDERRGEGKNLRGSERNIERSGDGGTRAGEDVEDGGVTSLNGQDGTGSIEDDGVSQQGSTTEVSGDTKILNNTSGGESGREIDQGRVKVELAVVDGRLPESLEGRLKQMMISIRQSVNQKPNIRTLMAVEWVFSSAWMFLSCSTTRVGLEKPALVISEAWNLARACM